MDGAASKLISGAGILLISPCGERFERALRFKFEASNNQAEYEALIGGLELAWDMGVPNLEICSDSQLVVNQIKGDYAAHNPVLARYRDMARDLLDQFEYYELSQIMRTDNTEADLLSRITEEEIEKLEAGCQIEFMETPVIDRVRIRIITDGEKDWVDEIRDYLEHQLLPTDLQKARILVKRAARYTIIRDILYKRSFSLPYLRCVKADKITNLLYESHEGICGGHPAARTLADKIRGQGFYWPTMRKDTEDYVRKCDQCQRFADIPRLPSTELTMVAPTWPFDMWGIDLIGPFPKA